MGSSLVCPLEDVLQKEDNIYMAARLTWMEENWASGLPEKKNQ